MLGVDRRCPNPPGVGADRPEDVPNHPDLVARRTARHEWFVLSTSFRLRPQTTQTTQARSRRSKATSQLERRPTARGDHEAPNRRESDAAPVDDLQRGARMLVRRDLDPERGVRGHDDQRVRRQLDRGVVADDQPPGTREVVVEPRRVDADHVEAVALADQTLRQPDELHHQRIDETVEIRRNDRRDRSVVVWRASCVHRSMLRNVVTSRRGARRSSLAGKQ